MPVRLVLILKRIYFALFVCAGFFALSGCNLSAQKFTGVSALSSSSAVTIDSPTEGQAFNKSSQEPIQFNGQCGFDGQPVLLTVGLLGGSAVCQGTAWSTALDISSLKDGVVSVTAVHTNTSGQRWSAQISIFKKFAVPVVNFVSPIAGSQLPSGNLSNVQVSGTCSENGQTVKISGDGTGQGPCISGTFQISTNFNNGKFGAVNISASLTDNAGNTGTANTQYGINLPLATLAVTSPPAGTYINLANQNSFIMSGSCSEAGSNILVTGLTVPNPWASQSLSVFCKADNTWKGTFDFSAWPDSASAPVKIGLSLSNKQGMATNLSYSLNKDTVPPVLTFSNLLSPAPNTVIGNLVSLGGSCGGVGLVTITATSGAGLPQQLASVLCSANGFSATNLALPLSLMDGNITFTASQMDAAGNLGTVSLSAIKDTTPPVLKIMAPISGTPVKGTVSLSGTCTNSSTGAAYPISVVVTDIATGTASAPVSVVCTAGAFSIGSLSLGAPDGQKVIAATQTKTFNSTVDTDTVVVVRLTAAPALTETTIGISPSYTNKTSIAFGGACSYQVTVTLPGGGTSQANCTSGSWSYSFADPGTDGAYAFAFDSQDMVGNKAATVNRVWNRLTVPPMVKFASPPSPAAGSYVYNTVQAGGTCAAGLTVALSATGATVAPTSTACSSGGTFSQSLALTATGGSGAITLRAAQTDLATNTASDALPLNLDLTIPIVAFTSPAPNTTINSTNFNAFSVAGNCSVANQNVDLTVAGTKLATVVCSGSGQFSANLDFTNISDAAAVTLTATSYSLAKTPGSGTLLLKKFTAPPTVTIDATIPPYINSLNVGSFTVTGKCTTSPANLGGSIKVQISTLAATGTCSAGAYSVTFGFVPFSTNPMLISLPDGNLQITASFTDVNGNPAPPVSVTILKDTQLPLLTVTPTTATTKGNYQTLAISCAPNAVIAVSGADTSSFNCSASGSATYQTNPQSIDGLYTYSFSETVHGNKSTASATWQRLTAAPVLALTSPVAGASGPTPVTFNLQGNSSGAGTYLQFNGTCSKGLTISVQDPGGNTTLTCDPNLSLWQYSSKVQTADGNYTYVFTETDSAGNASTITAVWTRTTQAPVINFTAPAVGSPTQVTAAAQSPNYASTTVSTTVSCVAGNQIAFNTSTSLAYTVATPTTTTSQTCPASGTLNMNFNLTGPDGPVVISVTASNIVGSTKSFLNIQKDTSQATVVPSATLYYINSVNISSFVVTGSCSVPGQSVVLSNPTGPFSLGNTTCSSTNTFSLTPSSAFFASLTEGKSYSATLNTFNKAGLAGPNVTLSFIQATILPVITFDTSVSTTWVNSTNLTAVAVSGTCVATPQSLATNKNVIITTLSGTANGQPVGLPSGTAACVAGRFSTTLDFSGVTDGTTNLTASFMDIAGNSAAAPTPATVSKDTVIPALTVSTNGQTLNANSTTFTVSGCPLGFTLTVAGADTAGPLACSSAMTYLTAAKATDGTYSYTFSANKHGNISSQTVSWTRLTTGPTFGISIPQLVALNPASGGSNVGGTSYASAGNSVAISGSCTVNTTVKVTDNGNLQAPFACPANGNWSYNFVPQTVDGTYNYIFTNTNSVGLTSTINFAWTRSTTPPAFAATAIASGMTFPATTSGNLSANPIYVMPNVTVTFSCVPGLAIAFTGASGGSTTATVSPASANCPVGGSISANYTLSGSDGAVTVSASETGATGLKTTVSLPLYRSGNPPTFQFTNHGPLLVNSVSQNAFSVSGTCNNSGGNIAFSLTDTSNNPLAFAVTGTAICSGSVWSASVNVSAAPDGNYYLVGADTPATGGTPVTDKALFQKLTIAPTLSIRSTTLTNSTVFNANGGTPQTYNIPDNAMQITVKAWGGGAVDNSGSQTVYSGSAAIVDLPVSQTGPQPPLIVIVGAQGTGATTGPGGASSVTMIGLNVVTAQGGNTQAVGNGANVLGASGITTSVYKSLVSTSPTPPLSTDPDFVSANAGLAFSLARGYSVSSGGVPGAGAGLVVIGWSQIYSFNAASYGVSGNCSANGAGITVSGGGASATATCNTSAAPNWSATLNLSSVPNGGLVTLTASQTDAVGNTGQATLILHRAAVQPFSASATWVVPPRVSAAYVKAWGAGGQGGANWQSSAGTGGSGAFVAGLLRLAGTTNLAVVAGTGGLFVRNGNSYENSGGGGGGYSGVFSNSITYGTALLVAGGGGGCGSGGAGGAGQGLSATVQVSSGIPINSLAAVGGWNSVTPGGGGGWDTPSAGAGGTSWINPIATQTSSAPAIAGGGPGNGSDPSLPAGYAVGRAGNASNGSPGYVIIEY